MCTRPRQMFWSQFPHPKSGRYFPTLKRFEAQLDHPVWVPCTKCIECRLKHSRDRAIRMMHEASLHATSSFVTLTYNDKHLPPHGAIRKEDATAWMKRLRERIAPLRIRSFGCAEYGEKKMRPHYHIAIFGFDFPDKKNHRRSKHGYPVYRSQLLEETWTFGFSEIGALTPASAGYIARYVCKKRYGPDADTRYEFIDEKGECWSLPKETFVCASNRPGLGADYVKKWGHVIYRDDSVVWKGTHVRPPRYYDVVWEKLGNSLSEVRDRREEKFRASGKAQEIALATAEARELISNHHWNLLKGDLE